MKEALDSIDKKDIRDFFCRDWMSHDGIWFAQCLKEIGIEKTNRINTNGIRAMAAAEIGRLVKMFNGGSGFFSGYDDLRAFLASAMDFVRPGFMEFEFSFPEKNELRIDFSRCWAHEGVRRLGVLDDYECAVVMRLKSWFDGLGIGYELTPDFTRCLMHTSGKCSFRFKMMM